MTAEFVLTNATIVTADELILGSVLVDHGRIVRIDSGQSGLPGAVDLEGDYLLPGLVELHTDNLERQFQPRPKVWWPSDAAMLAHDAQIIGAGIITVCDAICVGFNSSKRERLEFLQKSLDALERAEAAHTLKASHLLHLRCEVSDPHVIELFEPLKDAPRLKIVSFMDHTPGQRQWRDLDRYRTFHMGRTAASEAEFDELVERRITEQEIYADDHRRQILALLDGHDVALASHDDTTVEHVEQAHAEGMGISEFPTTLEAAEAAHRQAMAVVMGAPNVVLGGSHSGNASALDLAKVGLLDALSSDYVPASLLHAAFLIADKLSRPLPETVAMVSSAPARIIGLHDRGELAPGKRADMVRVRLMHDTPVVGTVWRQGARVA